MFNLHYRKPPVCRVPKFGHTANLPFSVCQQKEHTTNIWHTANIFFAMCHDKKHMANTQHTAKVPICHVLQKKAHGKEALFAVRLGYYTRQNCGTRQNYAKKSRFCTPNFFLLYIYSVLYSLLKFGIFFVIFAIFSHLISLIEFLGLNWKCFE